MVKSYYWPQQSPINLSRSSSYFVDFPINPLDIKYQGAYTGSFESHGGRSDFVIKENQDNTQAPEIIFNGKTATLKKIHLHIESEHDVEGNDLPGDIHLLHQINGTTKENPEYIVIGVFFDIRESEDPEGKKEPNVQSTNLKRMSESFQLYSTGEPGEIDIDPKSLMSSHDKWYWYYGSLTSPPYSENVTWIVLEELLTLDSDDFKAIKEFAEQPEREVFELDRRFVLRNFK